MPSTSVLAILVETAYGTLLVWTRGSDLSRSGTSLNTGRLGHLARRPRGDQRLRTPSDRTARASHSGPRKILEINQWHSPPGKRPRAHAWYHAMLGAVKMSCQRFKPYAARDAERLPQRTAARPAFLLSKFYIARLLVAASRMVDRVEIIFAPVIAFRGRAPVRARGGGAVRKIQRVFNDPSNF